MKGYDRGALIAAIDKLHEEACVMGWPAAQKMAAALGWSDDDEWPDGQWIRAALRDVLAMPRASGCSQEPHPGVEFYGDGGCGECGYRP